MNLGAIHQSAVSGKNCVAFVNQQRIREPELADAVCDLFDLSLGVRPGVLRIWDEHIDRHIGDERCHCEIPD